MSSFIEQIERAQLRHVPDFAPGDRVKVHFQVIEGTRRRVQVFEGVVIKRQGHGARETFTVRKQSFGVGVERTFPLHSPKIERIELASRGDVRRAKLYYLRDRVGKRARVRERRYTGPERTVTPGLVHEPPQPAVEPAAIQREEGEQAELLATLEVGGPGEAQAEQADPQEPTAPENEVQEGEVEKAGADAGETAGSDAGETAGSDAGETAGSDAGETAGADEDAPA